MELALFVLAQVTAACRLCVEQARQGHRREPQDLAQLHRQLFLLPDRLRDWAVRIRQGRKAIVRDQRTLHECRFHRVEILQSERINLTHNFEQCRFR